MPKPETRNQSLTVHTPKPYTPTPNPNPFSDSDDGSGEGEETRVSRGRDAAREGQPRLRSRGTLRTRYSKNPEP